MNCTLRLEVEGSNRVTKQYWSSLKAASYLEGTSPMLSLVSMQKSYSITTILYTHKWKVLPLFQKYSWRHQI